MNIEVDLQLALGAVLAIVAVAGMVRQRVNFPSRNRYLTYIAGWLLLLAGVALAEAYLHFGHSRNFMIASAVAVLVGIGPMLWGVRGFVRPKVK